MYGQTLTELFGFPEENHFYIIFAMAMITIAIIIVIVRVIIINSSPCKTKPYIHLCVEVFSVQKKAVHVKQHTFHFVESPHHNSDKCKIIVFQLIFQWSLERGKANLLTSARQDGQMQYIG